MTKSIAGLILVIYPFILSAEIMESSLGFSIEIPDNWHLVTPGNISQNEKSHMLATLMERRANSVIKDIESNKMEYLYSDIDGEVDYASEIRIQITQGNTISSTSDGDSFCREIENKLVNFYKFDIELSSCEAVRSQDNQYIYYSYPLLDRHSYISQYEFQITKDIVLLLTGESVEDNTLETNSLLNNIKTSIVVSFKDYPYLKEKSTNAYLSGDFKSAFDGMSKLAALGDLDAEYNIGVMYERGQGVEQDYLLAFDYYSRVTSKGSVLGISAMAKLYYHGYGVEKDIIKSLELYKLAAESGLSMAQNTYAGMLLLGEGTEKDPKEAIVWFNKAMGQGNREAALNLTRLYRLASDSGNHDASHALALIYLNGLTGQQHIPTALYLLEKAAESGHVPAQNTLHQIYSEGKYGIEKDTKKALLWQ